ncbi:MAG: conjugal transfer protein TraD, partial [Asticcacaulis sp.]
TYKRALPRKNLGMDRAVPDRLGNNTAFCRPRNYPYSINHLRQRKDTAMRKPRDYDAELKALEDKARELKIRKVQQLGELVIATGADGLTTEELAGALIVLAETTDAGKRESWAKRGSAFFQGRSRRSAPASDRDTGGAPTQSGGAQPASGGAGAA